ncbi:MAG: DNA-directed RNA polymerase subunit alpha C-terminal domain-containing protein [Chthoniobacteraceae bacterium]
MHFSPEVATPTLDDHAGSGRTQSALPIHRRATAIQPSPTDRGSANVGFKARERSQSSQRTLGVEQLDPWLVEFVEQKAEDLASLIVERAQEKLRAAALLGSTHRPRQQVVLDDDTLITVLPLTSRLIRALRRGGIETLGDFNKLGERELRRWHNVGSASLDQLRKFLSLAGRSLRE